jgi:hypothetical protein
MTKALTIEQLASVATVIGLIKMATVARNVYRTGNVESYNIITTSLGVITSLIWLQYDYSKGMKLGMVMAGTALMLDIYIAFKLLQKDKKDKMG